MSRVASGRRRAALAALLVATTLAAYWQALDGEWLLDDELHVTRPELQSAAGLVRIWAEIGATQQYYPVLHTAFWLEHRLWDDTAMGYHLMNVALHAVASLLVVALVRHLTLPGAWIAGFVFALHPLPVESVAWIAEQKNTLSAVFDFAAALAYLRFDRSRRTWQYLVASAFFLLALLSKTATATLPVALLVIIWWRRGRVELKRDLFPLAAWGFAALPVLAVTMSVERQLLAEIGGDVSLTWFERLLVAGHALWFYVAKLVWPVPLAFFHERWPVEQPTWMAYGFPVGAAAAVVAAVWRARRSRGPLAAVLFFVVTLLPVLGFVNVEWFVFSFAAEHFAYLASLAVIVPAAALVARAPAAAIGLSAACALLTGRHSGTFHDNVSLYTHAAACSPLSAVAHHHLGVALAKMPSRHAEAEAAFGRALRLNPTAAEAHANLGELLLETPARRRDAIAQLETALQLKPTLRHVRRRLAAAYFDEARDTSTEASEAAAAIAAYERALRLAPDFVEAHYNLANALAKLPDRRADAEAHYVAALRVRPAFTAAHLNLGVLLVRTPGRLTEAIGHFEAALRADPELAAARNNLERARRLLATQPTLAP